MTAATDLRARDLPGRLRVPRLRALPRGEAVSGHLDRPNRLLRGRPDRARRCRSALHGAGLLGGGTAFRRFGSERSSAASTALVRTDPAREQDWKSYAKSVVIFTRRLHAPALRCSSALQGSLFLNPDGLPDVPSRISLNTTASFVTNTNWQYYGGEYTMSYLSQMAGLAVQNFVSAAVGMVVLVAVIRGFTRRSSNMLGNFWQRPLPLARRTSCSRSRSSSPSSLISQGVPQTFDGAGDRDHARGRGAVDRARPGGQPDRHQTARNQRRRLLQLELCRPLREPERLHEHPRDALDPADPGGAWSSCSGRWSTRRKQGYAVFAAMFADVRHRRGSRPTARAARLAGPPRTRESTSPRATVRAAGTWPTRRCGSASPTRLVWAVATTNASNGSVNGGHDALTAGGGAVPHREHVHRAR